MTRFHGSKAANPDLYDAKSPGARSSVDGRFGRMFDLAELGGAHPGTSAQMLALGAAGGPMQESNPSSRGGNSAMPAGYTFLGQFVDHDLTLDVSSRFFNRETLPHIVNQRTAVLDLDCVYGAGPEATPFLYHSDGRHMHIGSTNGQDDLPRFEGRALIGDPRNDENIIVGHLQLAFLKFHNRIADADPALGIEEIRDTVVHYYHRILVEDFMPRLIGQALVDDILCDGRCYYYPEGFDDHDGWPAMPVEFAGAAYRYGHSQVRQTYKFNDTTDGELFQFGSFKPFQTSVDWNHFFPLSSNPKPQAAREIDRFLPARLLDLPFVPAGGIKSLATRNLLRGRSFRLPSGENVARMMVEDGVIDEAQVVKTHKDIEKLGMACTPLWFYVLHEAGTLHNGDQLGPVGGRIVGEVILGLVEHYRDLHAGKGLDYLPAVTVPQADATQFTMADMLRFI